jgi:hypothetical protein
MSKIQANQCDRCGALFCVEDDHPVVRVKLMHARMLSEKWELCLACQVSFRTWAKGVEVSPALDEHQDREQSDQ